MPVAFVGPALQGASLISRFGIPLLQQAGIAAGITGASAAINAATSKPQSKTKSTGRQKLAQAWGEIPDNLFSPEGGRFSYTTAGGTKGVQPSYKDAQGNTYDAVSGRLLYPAKKPAQVPFSKAVVTPAGTVQPEAIVSGLTPAGTVDYSQGDEYKAQMAQYRDLIAKKKEQEAEDLGMKIWMEKYGKSGLGLTGPNPLMQDFGGFVPTQGPTPAVLQTDESLKDVKGFFPGAGPEAFSPLDAQDQQQQATANQADMATTVKLPIRNRVQAFLQGGM